MALDGMIFDIDGTLIDTNPSHVEAWRRALESRGFRVARDRIEQEVGKGGDRLVPSILGQEAEARDGEALREAQRRGFSEIARRTRFRAFPRIPELFRALAARGIRTALATSSDRAQLDATLASAGVDITGLADALVTRDDAESSKPAPDLVIAAARALDLSPAQCAMVGDTVFDAEACRHAGVTCLAVLSGGKDPEDLFAAGARGAWPDTAALLAGLDDALAAASPGSRSIDATLADCLMREALAAARAALERGEVPIGAVVARTSGTVLARGHNELHHTGDRTAHAETVALRRAAGRMAESADDLILVTTVEPCVMCTGAGMQAGVDTILYGLRDPFTGGRDRVSPSRFGKPWLPRMVGGVLAAESRGLLEEWLPKAADPEQRRFVEQLLSEAHPSPSHRS
jgi:phosphoglycolate phosphatase-like HAD superfamily hydrolase/tRNA(Arg) A34 adenosine deaminase TadA